MLGSTRPNLNVGVTFCRFLNTITYYTEWISLVILSAKGDFVSVLEKWMTDVAITKKVNMTQVLYGEY